MIEIKRIDPEMQEKFITLSREICTMSDEEREHFIADEPHFPRQEKAQLLNTFIALMESIEDYETCASLLRLRNMMVSMQEAA